MNAIIAQNQAALAELCRQFSVRRLELFGSAATEAFDSTRSDLDFLVEFAEAPGMNRADQYFGLLFALEQLFGRPIDLVCPTAIRNRYFRRAVERSRVPLYAT
jgi:predicted nucleotidyltransferase